MKISKPARSRFFSLGWAISRLTCARLSSPLMASSEWPRPIRMAMKVMEGATVPLSQPSASGLNLMFSGRGGHRLVAGLENRHHAPDDQHHDHDSGDLHD